MVNLPLKTREENAARVRRRRGHEGPLICCVFRFRLSSPPSRLQWGSDLFAEKDALEASFRIRHAPPPPNGSTLVFRMYGISGLLRADARSAVQNRRWLSVSQLSLSSLSCMRTKHQSSRKAPQRRRRGSPAQPRPIEARARNRVPKDESKTKKGTDNAINKPFARALTLTGGSVSFVRFLPLSKPYPKNSPQPQRARHRRTPS